MEGESADVKGMVPVIVEVDNCCDEEKVALRLDRSCKDVEAAGKAIESNVEEETL